MIMGGNWLMLKCAKTLFRFHPLSDKSMAK